MRIRGKKIAVASLRQPQTQVLSLSSFSFERLTRERIAAYMYGKRGYLDAKKVQRNVQKESGGAGLTARKSSYKF